MSRSRLAVLVAAVILAVLIAAGSSILSFTALSDLAAQNRIDPSQAWIFPLIVDATVLAATLAVVVLREGKAFAWTLLGVSAALSIAGNVAHAWSAGPVAIAIAAVPPILLLATTHLVVVLAAGPAEAESHEQCKPIPLWPAAVKGHKSAAPDLAANWRAARRDDADENSGIAA